MTVRWPFLTERERLEQVKCLYELEPAVLAVNPRALSCVSLHSAGAYSSPGPDCHSSQPSPPQSRPIASPRGPLHLPALLTSLSQWGGGALQHHCGGTDPIVGLGLWDQPLPSGLQPAAERWGSSSRTPRSLALPINSLRSPQAELMSQALLPFPNSLWQLSDLL